MRKMNNNKLLERSVYEKWIKEVPKDECLLCKYNEYQIVIDEFDNWAWILAISPYWKYHTMLAPYRHVATFAELNDAEVRELHALTGRIEKSYNLLTSNEGGDSIPKNVVFFWRKRYEIGEGRDNQSNQHYHLHISPDKDHSWEPVLDNEAYKINVEEAIKLLRFRD